MHETLLCIHNPSIFSFHVGGGGDSPTLLDEIMEYIHVNITYTLVFIAHLVHCIQKQIRPSPDTTACKVPFNNHLGRQIQFIGYIITQHTSNLHVVHMGISSRMYRKPQHYRLATDHRDVPEQVVVAHGVL